MSVTVNSEFRLARGRKLYRDGKPCPSTPAADSNYSTPIEYYGWMLERAGEIIRAQRIREYCEDGIDL